MPIPNVANLYQKIHKGSEGGHEFARFIRLLLSADYEDQGIKFIAESDASGDFKKVDAYEEGSDPLPECIKAFQFKFYPTALNQNQKNNITDSIEKALEENPYIKELIFITPEDWMKEQLSWFERIKKKYEIENYSLEARDVVRKCYFRLNHWGHSKIIELCLKHDHIGSHYFPELYPNGVGKLKLIRSTLDWRNCDWLPLE